MKFQTGIAAMTVAAVVFVFFSGSIEHVPWYASWLMAATMVALIFLALWCLKDEKEKPVEYLDWRKLPKI